MFYLVTWETWDNWRISYYHIFYADNWEEAHWFCENHLKKEHKEFTLDEFTTLEELQKYLKELKKEMSLLKAI